MKKNKQNCMSCTNLQKCWAQETNSGNTISAQNVAINILVCRLQLGIKQDDAVKNILSIFKPGILRLLTYVKQTDPNLDADQIFADMQTTAIEYLLYDYKIGDRGRATPYLFDPQHGFLTKWVRWAAGKQRKFYSQHELYSPLAPSDDDNSSTNAEDDGKGAYHIQYSAQNRVAGTSWDAIRQSGDTQNEDTAPSELVKRSMEIIDDGITLNSNEYRVIKFCLAHSNEANASRHIDGLHIYLTRLLDVSRPRITRMYRRAKVKIINRYKVLMERENKAHDY